MDAYFALALAFLGLSAALGKLLSQAANIPMRRIARGIEIGGALCGGFLALIAALAKGGPALNIALGMLIAVVIALPFYVWLVMRMEKQELLKPVD